MDKGGAATADDQWVKTTCSNCLSVCGMLAHRVNGVVVDVKGEPDNPNNNGKLCAKGFSAIAGLYSPHRVRSPLERTNQEKGLGVDPRWKPVSWDYALNRVAERLSKIRKEDPRKLAVLCWEITGSYLYFVWGAAFGTPNTGTGGASAFCGNAQHPLAYMVNGSWVLEVDYKHTNYCMVFGAQQGFGADTRPPMTSRELMDARARGMKLVVVDPRCSMLASKADEWLPVLPGTDGALALGILNHILNELGIFDEKYLEKHTNAPYLVKPNGHYARDEKSGAPLVWDSTTNQPRPFNDSPALKPMLTGAFSVQNESCSPAFELLKSHLKRYSVEWASQITTIPESTIRRVAQEFAHEAKIGSTIEIDKKILPFRPVSVAFDKGVSAHKHSMETSRAIMAIPLVLGAIDVPGGTIGGPPPVSPWWQLTSNPDGLIVSKVDLIKTASEYPYVDKQLPRPQNMHLKSLFPIAIPPFANFPLAILEPKKFGLNYSLEMLIQNRTNIAMTFQNPEAVSKALTKIDFMTSISLEVDETAELADIVLPDLHFLESTSVLGTGHYMPGGQSPWVWPIVQRVVQPPFEAPFDYSHSSSILFELADRCGFIPDLYDVINAKYNLKPKCKLDPSRRYTIPEILDRLLMSLFGEEYGLDWFKKNGVYKPQRSIDHAYPYDIKPRVPIYYENILTAGEAVKDLTDRVGLSWDTSDYTALPTWKACPAYEETSGEYDLFAINFKTHLQINSSSTNNAWLTQLSERQRLFDIWMHPETARKRGIDDGDTVRVESSQKYQVKGKVMLTEAIHPKVVGIPGCFGHWSKGMPIAYGKGTNYNTLLPLGHSHVDLVAGSIDSCVKVKVSKE